MTEPEVSGADPTGLRTTAVLDGGRVGDRRSQVVFLGRRGRRLRRSSWRSPIPTPPPRRRMSQIIVPADAPGVEIEPVPVLGHRGRGWSTHCEVRYQRRPRSGREHPRRARRRVPDRADAARPGSHPPRHAVARPDAARLRADVQAGAGARGLRRPARRQADGAELDRRLGRGDPRLPADDLRRGHKIDEGADARVEISLHQVLRRRPRSQT